MEAQRGESEGEGKRRGGASRQGDLHSTSSGVRMGERERGRERKGGWCGVPAEAGSEMIRDDKIAGEKDEKETRC